jgi:hypothetical protein
MHPHKFLARPHDQRGPELTEDGHIGNVRESSKPRCYKDSRNSPNDLKGLAVWLKVAGSLPPALLQVSHSPGDPMLRITFVDPDHIP